MNKKQIWAVYFSPTGTTKKVVCHAAMNIAKQTGCTVRELDFTTPKVREQGCTFGSEDLVVLGVPVYAGRVPNVLLKELKGLKGQGTAAIPVVLFGNRAFDDALIELRNIMEENGFNTIAAGAFVGEHAFSETLAQGRPDAEDMQLVDKLANAAGARWLSNGNGGDHPVVVPGNDPLAGYYQPQDRAGNPVDIRKVKPLVNEQCNNCKRCVQLCPMGSIDPEDVSNYRGICIKCGACIKGCAVHARYYEDEGYLYHKNELEAGLKRRAKSQYFIN